MLLLPVNNDKLLVSYFTNVYKKNASKAVSFCINL